MKMQKFTVINIWLLCIIICACNSTKSLAPETATISSESDIPQVERWVNGDFKIVRVDRLGNVYAVEQGNDVIRMDKDGQELFRYSNNRLAQLTNIDVSNPQKLLLYYNSFQVAIMLDNTLSEIQKIDFNRLGLWDIQAIGMSNDNHIWYFDLADYRLKKITSNGKELNSSNSLSKDGFQLLQLDQIQESNQLVYLNSAENGLLIFDNLGGFIQHIPEIQTAKLKPLDDNLVYLNEKGNIFVYNNIIDGAKALSIQNVSNQQIVDFDLINKLIYYVDQFGIEKLNIE